MPKTALKISNLDERHPGLTKNYAGTFTEAASVCLERHHISPTDFDVQNEDEYFSCEVEWISPDARTCRSHANEIDTTECGAYAVCLATVEVTRGLFAVRRAETLTGADFYVGPPESQGDDLEDCYRFEVSGVDKANETAVRKRLGEKVEQTRKGKSNLPAIACVVGFRVKLVALAELKES